jgi:hypothetical protein
MGITGTDLKLNELLQMVFSNRKAQKANKIEPSEGFIAEVQNEASAKRC